MEILSIAFSLFLLMDSIGNIPFYISFLKKVAKKRQKVIILRELLIALFIIFLFSFLGNGLMRFLHIGQETVQISGGIILFLMSLKMVFPNLLKTQDSLPHDPEPFIVPLAIPLIAGPAVLAAVMIYSKQVENVFIMCGAILIAWFLSLLVLLSAPFLGGALGQRGIIAMERLMGLILILISVEMFLSGISEFVENCHA